MEKDITSKVYEGSGETWKKLGQNTINCSNSKYKPSEIPCSKSVQKYVRIRFISLK